MKGQGKRGEPALIIIKRHANVSEDVAIDAVAGFRHWADVDHKTGESKKHRRIIGTQPYSTVVALYREKAQGLFAGRWESIYHVRRAIKGDFKREKEGKP